MDIKLTEIDGIKIPDTSDTKTVEEWEKKMEPFLKIFLNKAIKKEIIKQNKDKVLQESDIEKFYVK